jgi:nicotinamidase-related amidase
MSSGVIHDPLADHLITPQNAALVLIDDQPAQFATVRSMDPELPLNNIVSTVKTAKTFGLPISHSTINVAPGRQSRPSPSSPVWSGTVRRSTEPASTRGRTSTWLRRCVPPGVAS